MIGLICISATILANAISSPTSSSPPALHLQPESRTPLDGFLRRCFVSHRPLRIETHLHHRRSTSNHNPQGIPISEYGVLVDMISVPDWAFKTAAGQETRGMGFRKKVLVDMIRVPDWAFETAAGQEMRGMGFRNKWILFSRYFVSMRS